MRADVASTLCGVTWPCPGQPADWPGHLCERPARFPHTIHVCHCGATSVGEQPSLFDSAT